MFSSLSSLEARSRVNAIELADHWWALALRGTAAVLFGILSFVAPALSLLALIALFGAYALLDGAFNLVHAFRTRRTGQPWGWLVASGSISVAAAAVTFFWPKITALALLVVIAAWAIVTGGMTIAAAVRLRREIKGEWLLAASGVLSVAFGVLMLLFPAAGALAVVFWIAAYAVVLGVLLIAAGFKLRSWAHGSAELPTGGRGAPAPL